MTSVLAGRTVSPPYLLAAANDGRIGLFFPEDFGQQQIKYHQVAHINSDCQLLKIRSFKQKTFYAVDRGGYLTVFDYSDFKQLHREQVHSTQAWGLAIFEEKDILCTASWDASFKIFDISDPYAAPKQVFSKHVGGYLFCACFAKRRNYLLIADYSRRALVLDVGNNYETVHTFSTSAECRVITSFDKDTKIMCADGNCFVTYSLLNFTKLLSVSAHTDILFDLSLIGDSGKFLVTGSYDNSVCVWKPDYVSGTAKKLQSFKTSSHVYSVRGFEMSSKTYISFGSQSCMYIKELKEGETEENLEQQDTNTIFTSDIYGIWLEAPYEDLKMYPKLYSSARKNVYTDAVVTFSH